MNIIPVIDLLDGQVVHAKHGNRKNYQPIRSVLCGSSAPDEIVNSLMRLYPFTHLYIADINAIQGTGHHLEAIQNIRQQHPQIEIWLDAGINQATIADNWSVLGVVPVIGSESIVNINDYHAICQPDRDYLLSLDWLDNRLIGPAELFEDTEDWPEYIIAMTLNKVGSGSGPDIPRLKQLQAKHQNVYAAGGIRDIEDLKSLAELGIAGVLVATALHTGMLSNKEIALMINS